MNSNRRLDYNWISYKTALLNSVIEIFNITIIIILLVLSIVFIYLEMPHFMKPNMKKTQLSQSWDQHAKEEVTGIFM